MEQENLDKQAYIDEKINSLIDEQERKLKELDTYLKNPYLGKITKEVLEKQKQDIQDNIYHLKKQ